MYASMLSRQTIQLSVPMKNRCKQRKFLGLILGLSLLLPCAHVWALDCKDVGEIDQAEKAAGAFLMWSGCTPLNAEAIAERWMELPESAKKWRS